MVEVAGGDGYVGLVAGGSCDESTVLDQLVNSGKICQLENMLAELHSGGKRSVILKATLGFRDRGASTDIVANPSPSSTIISTKLQVITFVISNFKDFLNENPADLLDFIVRYINDFPDSLIDFVLDKLAQGGKFRDLSNIRGQGIDRKIRHKARDLLDANVGNISDPNVLAIIGAFGLSKPARRTAIERLAQSSGNGAYLSFIATTSADRRFPVYCDDGISALARKTLQQ